MIRLKTSEELEGIRTSCALLSETLLEARDWIREGVTTKDIDSFIRGSILKKGAQPAFLGYLGFPASACISLNETVIHGIPGKRRLKSGDLVSIDCGLVWRGYYSDAAFTLPVGGAAGEQAERLLTVTRECLRNAIDAAVFGNRLSDISRAVFDHAKRHGFGVVREYCGHGVGFSQHEDPQVPNYVSRGPDPRLKEGLVLAIEPMINLGGDEVEVLDDGWTVVTADGSLSAHFEHTIAVLRDRTEILTRWE